MSVKHDGSLRWQKNNTKTWYFETNRATLFSQTHEQRNKHHQGGRNHGTSIADRLSKPMTLTASPPDMSWSKASPRECAGSVLITRVLVAPWVAGKRGGGKDGGRGGVMPVYRIDSQDRGGGGGVRWYQGDKVVKCSHQKQQKDVQNVEPSHFIRYAYPTACRH